MNNIQVSQRFKTGRYMKALAHIGRVDWQKGIAAAQFCVLEMGERLLVDPVLIHHDAKLGARSVAGHETTHFDFAVEQIAKLIKKGELQRAWDLCDDYKRVMGIDPFKLKEAAKRKAESDANKA